VLRFANYAITEKSTNLAGISLLAKEESGGMYRHFGGLKRKNVCLEKQDRRIKTKRKTNFKQVFLCLYKPCAF